MRSLGTGTSCSSAGRAASAGTGQRVAGGWWGFGGFLWLGGGSAAGPTHVGTHLPLCAWHPVVAGQRHGQPQRLGPPCPAQAVARWHQGAPGGSFSLCGWTGDSHREARGLVAHPQGLHQGSVTVLVSPSWHEDGQGTCSAGPRQAGDKAGPWQQWQWPLPAAAPGLLRLFLGTRMREGFARSCFLLKKTPVGKKTPQNNPRDPSPDTCSPPAALLDSRNQLVLGCAWRGFGCQSQPWADVAAQLWLGLGRRTRGAGGLCVTAQHREGSGHGAGGAGSLSATAQHGAGFGVQGQGCKRPLLPSLAWSRV